MSFARHWTEALLSGSLSRAESYNWPLWLRLRWHFGRLFILGRHARRWATWDLLLYRRNNSMQRRELLLSLQARDRRRLERRSQIVSAVTVEMTRIHITKRK